MSLNANALATFAQAVALFGYQADEQNAVENLINIASARMEIHCRRALAARDYVLLLEGTGCDTLILPEYPVNTVTRLSIDSLRTFGTESDVPATGYSLRKGEGTIRLYAGWFGAYQCPDCIHVEFNAGYAPTHPQLPVLQAACCEYVDWLKSRFANPGSIGKKGEYSADRVSVSYETEMPMHVRSALESFVRVVG